MGQDTRYWAEDEQRERDKKMRDEHGVYKAALERIAALEENHDDWRDAVFDAIETAEKALGLR